MYATVRNVSYSIFRFYSFHRIFKTPNRFYRGDLVTRVVHWANRSVSGTWGLPDLSGELGYLVHSAHNTRMNVVWLVRNLQNMHFFAGREPPSPWYVNGNQIQVRGINFSARCSQGISAKSIPFAACVFLWTTLSSIYLFLIPKP